MLQFEKTVSRSIYKDTELKDIKFLPSVTMLANFNVPNGFGTLYRSYTSKICPVNTKIIAFEFKNRIFAILSHKLLWYPVLGPSTTETQVPNVVVHCGSSQITQATSVTQLPIIVVHIVVLAQVL